jgi:hypothetical protein
MQFSVTSAFLQYIVLFGGGLVPGAGVGVLLLRGVYGGAVGAVVVVRGGMIVVVVGGGGT